MLFYYATWTQIKKILKFGFGPIIKSSKSSSVRQNIGEVSESSSLKLKSSYLEEMEI